jgi:carboxymethylenebutenolidase
MAETHDLELTTADGPMRVFEAMPSTPAPAAVVVIMEAFGVNSYVEDVTERLADAGYQAVAPDLFHRAGGGTAPYGDFSKVLPMFDGLTDDGILMDVDAAIDHLADDGFGNHQIGIVGFCFGGRVTFLTALRRHLGAAVGFYGGGIVTARFPQFPPLVGDVAQLQTPWLGFFGDLDEGIPIEDVEQLRAALKADAPVDNDVVRYRDAGHGFHCHARDAYHAESADDAWRRTLEWFAFHLAVEPPT